MKDGGTGRRGEMNLSVQKASVAGNRFARRWRAAGGTDGEERRGEEVGVFPSVCYPGECKRANLLDFVQETSEKTERARRDCQVVTALTQTAT